MAAIAGDAVYLYTQPWYGSGVYYILRPKYTVHGGVGGQIYTLGDPKPSHGSDV